MAFYSHMLVRKHLKKYQKIVDQVNLLESEIKPLSDIQIKLEISKIRNALSKEGIRLFPRFMALAREAGLRSLGMRAYDVQLLGAIALYEGRLAEMATGEGKTLTIVFAAAFAALQGRGVHVVTANDYLAKRDSEAMRPFYEALGLTVGLTEREGNLELKKLAYGCDVTYGVNYEFGFDYLRDNLALSEHARVQRGLVYAIIDEVDSVLIDEARTPLIISGDGNPDVFWPTQADAFVRLLSKDQYFINEKRKEVELTEAGYSFLEEWLLQQSLRQHQQSPYSNDLGAFVHSVASALKAHKMLVENKDYVVEDGEVVIVDENTGRKMPGRRWGEGLHIAVELKAGVSPNPETKTKASITYQSFFGLYSRISGLTGTASTEEEEFSSVYNLEIVKIPTHRPVKRIDHVDNVFVSKAGKLKAFLQEVRTRHERGQPLLIGTASVASSEELSQALTKAGLPHQVLNAKNHAIEAQIIEQAGAPFAITVATNMAGRGTDIILGGVSADVDNSALKAQVLAAGGLCVMGWERNDSRRIDNQLRGRAGRQGDAGESIFYVSLDDDMLRVFGENRFKNLAKLTGVDDSDVLTGHSFSKAIRRAQSRIEALGYDARKYLIKFDSVIGFQRNAFYATREQMLTASLPEVLETAFSFLEDEPLKEKLMQLSEENVERIRVAILQVLDLLWEDHLTHLQFLQESVQLRAVAQKDPFREFSLEAYKGFELLRQAIPSQVEAVCQFIVDNPEMLPPTEDTSEITPTWSPSVWYRPRLASVQRRMALCGCGSGKRYKNCCGKLN